MTDKHEELTLDYAELPLADRLTYFMEQGPIRVEAKRFNSFTKSYYASFDDVLAQVAGPLSRYGLMPWFRVMTEDSTTVRMWLTGPGTDDMHLAGSIPINLDGTPQQIGAQITYYKRYLLCAALNVIGAEEDRDGNLEDGEVAGEPVIEHIEKLAADTGADMDALLTFCHQSYAVDRLDQLTTAQANTILNMLKVKKQKQGADDATKN